LHSPDFGPLAATPGRSTAPASANRSSFAPLPHRRNVRARWLATFDALLQATERGVHDGPFGLTPHEPAQIDGRLDLQAVRDLGLLPRWLEHVLSFDRLDRAGGPGALPGQAAVLRLVSIDQGVARPDPHLAGLEEHLGRPAFR